MENPAKNECRKFCNILLENDENFRLYLTGIKCLCMRSMVSVSSPPCLRYALHMLIVVAKLIL